MKILIANRGEIARRVIRTANRLGHATVAVYADPDAGAPFVGEATEAVRIGPAALAESYLSTEAILAAAAATDVTAVHPGYGFLSENAAFARAVIDAGLTWVGPHPEAIDAMGSKIDARQLATNAGVPVIPGFDTSQDPADLAAAADTIGYPILVKAAAGGGGKGIRIAHEPNQFATALADAKSESLRSFGDDDVIVERYIQRPRHVEVQIVGDKLGAVINLGTRECSVQRRYQKVLEEAPAPNLPEATRAGLRQSATALGASIGYDSTGTVEFIVDDETGDYFFLEMNTRLQVEHPVTEAITGLDLVELQLSSAAGQPLPLTQDAVAFSGHAFEARINAEDASNDFAPQTGRVTHLSVPNDVRWDSGIEAGTEISPHYDPMVAKLVVHAADRPQALAKLRTGLDNLVIGGLTTNAGFHRWLVDQSPVVDGRVTTRFLDETDIADTTNAKKAAPYAAAAWMAHSQDANATSPWRAAVSFRLVPHQPTGQLFLADTSGVVHDVDLTVAKDLSPGPAAVATGSEPSIVVNVDGQSHTFAVLSRSQRWAPQADAGHGTAGAVAAPFPAVVADVPVTPGQAVIAGDAVVVIEAMKMLHTLSAAGPGVVDEVRVETGQQVESNQVLVTFVTPETDSSSEEN